MSIEHIGPRHQKLDKIFEFLRKVSNVMNRTIGDSKKMEFLINMYNRTVDRAHESRNAELRRKKK